MRAWDAEGFVAAAKHKQCDVQWTTYKCGTWQIVREDRADLLSKELQQKALSLPKCTAALPSKALIFAGLQTLVTVSCMQQ